MNGRPLPAIGRRALLAGLSGLGMAYLSAWRGDDARAWSAGQPVVVASGSVSGVYNQYAQAWSAAAGPDKPLRVMPTTGSLQNIQLLADQSVSLAFCAIDAAAPTAGRPDGVGRALGRLYDDYLHLAVPGWSDISTIGDLRGKRVCVGASASGTELISERLLAASGIDSSRDITRVELSLDDSVTALRAGELDALFWSGGLPTHAIAELAANPPRSAAASGSAHLRLVGLGDATRALRGTFGTAYRIGVIPGYTYSGIPGTTTTLAVPNVLLAAASMTAVQAHDLTGLLFEDAPRIGRTVPVASLLDRHTAIFTEPVALHPGAVEYYRKAAVDV